LNPELKFITLGEIGRVAMCKRVLKKQTDEKEEIPFYKISTFGQTPMTFISRELFENFKSKYSYPKKGDVLISAAGTIGKTVIFDGRDSYFQDSNIVWIDNDELKVTNQFLYYYYQTKPWIPTNGSTIKRLYNEDIRSLIITYPSLSEQKKITKILSDLDSKIELNNRMNAELESMAKLIYDYWFIQFDFPDENGNPYKSSGGKMVYNEELNREIPNGWVIEHLEQLIDIYDSKRIPLSKSERENRKGIYPYFGATGILDYVDDFIFDGEYILLAEDGSVMNEEGNPIVQFIWGKTWVNNHAHVIRAKKEELNEYIFQGLSRIPVVLIKSGSIQMKINQRNLLSFSIVKPPEHLMLKYSDDVKAVRKKMMINIEENQKLAELRDWLLPMLMNGQVTIKD